MKAKAIRLYLVPSNHSNVVAGRMVPLGYETQLFLYPHYCLHTLPFHYPPLSSLPHSAIQNEILLNLTTFDATSLRTQPSPLIPRTSTDVEHTMRVMGNSENFTKKKSSLWVLLREQTPRTWVGISRVVPLLWPTAAAASLSANQALKVERAVQPRS